MTKEERREYYRKLEMSAAEQERIDRRVQQRRMWDMVHYRTISCRVPADVAQRFEALCRKHHTTRYRAVQDAVMAALRADAGPHEARYKAPSGQIQGPPAASPNGISPRSSGAYPRAPFEE